MRRDIVLVVMCVMTIAGTVCARDLSWQWGPWGFDHKGTGKRFSVQEPYQKKASLEIWVDAAETVDGVAKMVLQPSGSGEVVSQYCSKAERHITAPWACGFSKEVFLPLHGQGTVIVLDGSDKVLLRDVIDFDFVQKALKAMDQK